MPGVDSGAVNETYGVTEADIVKEIGGALINATICSSIIFLLTLCFGMQTLAMPITVTLSLFVVILFASIFGTAAFIKPDENRSGLSDRSVYYSDQRYHRSEHLSDHRPPDFNRTRIVLFSA